MKSLKNFINEGFKLGKNKVSKIIYNYFPKNKIELKEILEERLAKDKNVDLNDIDVSNITDMSYLFNEQLNPYNIDISEWDVSEVESMEAMFAQCENFNSDLYEWDVSKVEDMGHIFHNCTKFEGKGLENWDVFSVKYTESMFDQCDSLKNKPSWYKY